MRWRDQRRSSNVEDRRGMGGRGVAIGGGGIGLLVLAALVYLCGGDAQSFLEQAPQQRQTGQQQTQPRNSGQPDEKSEFVKVVLGSTEDVWEDVFRQNGLSYREPKLVLFTQQVASACGNADSSMGPFYCPGDQKLYLDFAFFDELRSEFKAPGDFAQAYVIAHEVGHHVQNLLGTMDQVTRAQRASGEGAANSLSVRLELQADCFAGIWAAEADRQGLVEAGDAEEAIRAAQSVGDDMIQKRTRGYIVPDSFTHGSAEDRVRWFTTGFRTGDVKQCRTFE